jgi:hypothetical protein
MARLRVSVRYAITDIETSFELGILGSASTWTPASTSPPHDAVPRLVPHGADQRPGEFAAPLLIYFT